MRTTVEQERVDRLNLYLELEMRQGPVLLPRFWWTLFAFIIPCVLAGSSLLLLAVWQHSAQLAEPFILQAGTIAGFVGLSIATYFYWSLVCRVRH